MSRPVVCVDFDGVLNLFDGWRGPKFLHPPRPGAREFLQSLCDQQYQVVIHTVRWAPDISAWLRSHGLDQFVHSVTNQKVAAHVYVDDRAICFRGDFDDTLHAIAQFKAHWESPELSKRY